jgi:MFS family permease
VVGLRAAPPAPVNADSHQAAQPAAGSGAPGRAPFVDSAHARPPVPPSPASGADPSRRPAWSALGVGGRMLLSAYIATFVVFFCRNGLLNAVVPVLGADRYGLQPYQIGVVFSGVNALSIGVVLLGGRAGDRFGRHRLLVPGLAVLLLAQSLLLFVHDAASYVVIALLQSVSFFVNPLPPGLLGDTLPVRARAQGIAVYRAVSDLALLSAPSVMGAALQFGGFPAAELASVLIIAVALLAVAAVGTRRPAD